jgi:hypothetical protein
MGLNKSASLAQNCGVQILPWPPSAATPASGGHKTGQESTSGSGGQKRREESIPGHERGHVPSAVPGATTCPRSNRRAATGGCPYMGKREADRQSPMRRYCGPVFAAPKGRPRIARGKSRGTRDAAPGNAPSHWKRPARAARAERSRSNAEPALGDPGRPADDEQTPRIRLSLLKSFGQGRPLGPLGPPRPLGPQGLHRACSANGAGRGCLRREPIDWYARLLGTIPEVQGLNHINALRAGSPTSAQSGGHDS